MEIERLNYLYYLGRCCAREQMVRSFTHAELRFASRYYRLGSSGSKARLVDRLLAYFECPAPVEVEVEEKDEASYVSRLLSRLSFYSSTT